jgi:hypothetical protein
LHDEQTVNGLRKIVWLPFPFFRLPCLHVFMSLCPFSMSMSHVSMSHVSMSPRLHVSTSLCLHVSMFPCLHFSIFPCLMFMSLCFHVSRCPCIHLHVVKRKTELTEEGKFRLFTASRERKRQTLVCLLQTETENGSCFPWSANVKRYIQPFALKSYITPTKYMKLSYSTYCRCKSGLVSTNNLLFISTIFINPNQNGLFEKRPRKL